MAAIRPIDVIASTWAEVTPQRAPQYEAGVRDPRADWGRNTLAATKSWEAGVQAAISAGSFGKGVTRVGTAGWQKGAIDKGTVRWGPGVILGIDAYRTGFAPFRDVIERLTLPPRFARRDPRNLLRVAAIAKALGDAKAARGGA